jgi:hypothetical protein
MVGGCGCAVAMRGYENFLDTTVHKYLASHIIPFLVLYSYYSLIYVIFFWVVVYLYSTAHYRQCIEEWTKL